MMALSVAVLCFLGAGDDAARIEHLGHQMMCVCGCNQILLECNHVGCAYSSRMRDQLVAAVGRGESDNSVLQSFIHDYGTTVLAVPTNRGFNRVAWIMPYAALVGGIMLVALIARSWKKRSAPLPAKPFARARAVELEQFREQARRETRL
jgi:cytochrome c-type biogenesis protein CcmH